MYSYMCREKGQVLWVGSKGTLPILVGQMAQFSAVWEWTEQTLVSV
jgi:hypothetical protein